MVEAEKTVVFKSIAYSGGIILGGWGLIEIFLRVDPFYALFLRNLDGVGWLVAGAASVLIILHITPGPLGLEGDRYQCRGLGIATAAIGLAVFAVGIAAPPLFGTPPLGWLGLDGALIEQGVVFVTGALFATALACAVCPAVPIRRAGRDEPARVWPHWLGIPVVVGMVVVSVMLLLVSTGRVRSLTEGDIAQEELRRGGLEFSMTSLQEALYLISPRSVELFRKANVDDVDILDALGAPTGFTGAAPLITSILSRIDGDDDLVCSPDVLDAGAGEGEGAAAEAKAACRRIDSFIRLFLVEPEPIWYRQLFEADDAENTMCFPTRPSDRELASMKMASGEDGGEGQSLCDRLEDAIPLRTGDGAPPRPLLSYAFSGGHANVAHCVLALCGHPGSDIEIRPLSEDPAVDTAFGPSQGHIRFALNPYWAVTHGRSAPDSPWAPEEAKAFEAVLRNIVAQSENPLQEGATLPADAAVSDAQSAGGIHVTHADGRCRARALYLAETGEGQLHDKVPFRSYALARPGDETALQGLLLNYGDAQPNLRLVHERPQDEGGERLVVLDQVVDEAGLVLLSGTDTSVLLGLDGQVIAEPTAGDTLHPVAGAQAEIAPSLGWETLPINMAETGRLVLSGRAESDLCLEVLDAREPEGHVVMDVFVPHARNFAVETEALRAGPYALRATALRDDTGALPTTIRAGVRPTLFCTHTDPDDDDPFQIIGSGRAIAPYRAQEATGNRLYCSFRTENFALVTFVAESEADVEVRLVERVSGPGSSDTTSWTDSAGSGTAGAPARERVTALVQPKRSYVLELRPFSDADLTGTPLVVSLTEGPAVTETELRVAVANAERVDGGTSGVLTPQTPPVAAARIAEAGPYAVEANEDARAFRFNRAAEEVLSEIEGGPVLDLSEGEVIVALATTADGGPVTIDPMASRQIALGRDHRFEALESENTRIHVVEPEGDGPLEITLTPLDGEDLDLTVKSSDGADLGSSTAGGAAVDRVTVDGREGTPLIVEVSALGTSAYTLRAADPRESLGEAPELLVGEAITRETLPADEQLRFRLTADRSGALTVTLTPFDGDLDLKVLSLSGTELGSSANSATEIDEATVTTAAGEILIVEVNALEASGFALTAQYR